MYLSHWGMQRRPFESCHALEFFVPYDSARLAIHKLRYVLENRQGVATLDGMAGVGKSQVARMLERDLAGAGWTCLYVPYPGNSAAEGLGLLASRLGVPREEQRWSPFDGLAERLSVFGETGSPLCVILDDCHTMDEIAFFDDLRMLLNVEAGGRPVLNLLLLGQSRLHEALTAASGFSSHVGLSVTLPSMSEEETKMYVLYRLKVAGCQRGIFTRHAASVIAERSGGIPRHVNRLCEVALIGAFGAGQQKVSPEIVEEAAETLHLGQTDEILGDAAAVPEDDILAGLGSA